MVLLVGISLMRGLADAHLEKYKMIMSGLGICY